MNDADLSQAIASVSNSVAPTSARLPKAELDAPQLRCHGYNVIPKSRPSLHCEYFRKHPHIAHERVNWIFERGRLVALEEEMAKPGKEISLGDPTDQILPHRRAELGVGS